MADMAETLFRYADPLKDGKSLLQLQHFKERRLLKASRHYCPTYPIRRISGEAFIHCSHPTLQCDENGNQHNLEGNTIIIILRQPFNYTQSTSPRLNHQPL